MSRQLDLYRFTCVSGMQFEVWSELAPTECPNGNLVSSGTITIIDTLADTQVEAVIIEENVPTGGHFQSSTVVLTVTGSGDWEDLDISWPIPISILSAQYVTTSEHEGDLLEAYAAPDMIIGALTAPAVSGATTFNVQQSVVDNIKVGYWVKLLDANVGTEEDLGRILAIDEVALTIEVETAAIHAFAPAPAPTYVKMTSKYIEDVVIGPPNHEVVGGSKIGASYLPANTVLRLRYKRVLGTATKLVVRLEYLY